MSVVKRFVLDGTTYDIEPTIIDSVPTAGSNNTVSSSGVKSYVDSNYVPLSATQAPVTGLTDILTPVNLLPNSDFSRAGGIASPITFANINKGTTYVYQPALGWSLILGHGADRITNVTVTRTAGKLNVTGTIGTIEESDSGGIWIRLAHSLSYKKTFYTLYGRVRDNINTSTAQAYINVSGTIERVYLKNTNTESIHIIDNREGNASYLFTTIYIYGYNSGDAFDIDFYDPCLYEGEFKNPPVTTSLDVKPSNVFTIIDGSNFASTFENYRLKEFNSMYSSNVNTKIIPTQTFITANAGKAAITELGKIIASAYATNNPNMCIHGTIYIAGTNGGYVVPGFTRYSMIITVKYDSYTTPTVTTTLTKDTSEGGVAQISEIILEYRTQLNNANRYDIIPYLKVTNSRTNMSSYVQINYDCFLSGPGIYLYFPVHGLNHYNVE